MGVHECMKKSGRYIYTLKQSGRGEDYL